MQIHLCYFVWKAARHRKKGNKCKKCEKIDKKTEKWQKNNNITAKRIKNVDSTSHQMVSSGISSISDSAIKKLQPTIRTKSQINPKKNNQQTYAICKPVHNIHVLLLCSIQISPAIYKTWLRPHFQEPLNYHFKNTGMKKKWERIGLQ